MAQEVKALATEPDSLSMIPKTPTLKDRIDSCKLSNLHKNVMEWGPLFTINKTNAYLFKIFFF